MSFEIEFELKEQMDIFISIPLANYTQFIPTLGIDASLIFNGDGSSSSDDTGVLLSCSTISSVKTNTKNQQHLSGADAISFPFAIGLTFLSAPSSNPFRKFGYLIEFTIIEKSNKSTIIGRCGVSIDDLVSKYCGSTLSLPVVHENRLDNSAESLFREYFRNFVPSIKVTPMMRTWQDGPSLWLSKQSQLLKNPFIRTYSFPQEHFHHASIFASELTYEVTHSFRVPAELLSIRMAQRAQLLKELEDISSKARIHCGYPKDDAEAFANGFSKITINVENAKILISPTPEASSNSGTASATFGKFLKQTTSTTGGSVPSPYVVITLDHMESNNDHNAGKVAHHGSQMIGRTNTEYRSFNPVWGSNHNIKACEHSNPATRHESAARAYLSDATTFIFYAKTTQVPAVVTFHLYHERFSVSKGIIHVPMAQSTLYITSTDFPSKGKRLSIPLSGSAGDLFVHCSVTPPVGNSLLSQEEQIILSKVPHRWMDLFILSIKKDLELLQKMHMKVAMLLDQASTNGSSFKSSKDKKVLELGAVSTNLNLTLFVLGESKDAKSSSSSKQAVENESLLFDFGAQPNAAPKKELSTEDQLVDFFSMSSISTSSPPPPLAQKHLSTSKSSSIGSAGDNISRVIEPTHIMSTTSTGAPAAHVLGFHRGLYSLKKDYLELQKQHGSWNPATENALHKLLILNTVHSGTETYQCKYPECKSSNSCDLQGFCPKHASYLTSASGQGAVSGESAHRSSIAYSSVGRSALASVAAVGRKLAQKAVGSENVHEDEGEGLEAFHQLSNIKSSRKTPVGWQLLLQAERELWLRETLVLSQVLGTLITTFLSEIELCFARSRILSPENKTDIPAPSEYGTQIRTSGFLIGFESLVSTAGNELIMLDDSRGAMKLLEGLTFRIFPHPTVGSLMVALRDISQGIISISMGQNDFHIMFPSQTPLQYADVGVRPVLFTQGINEVQSLANATSRMIAGNSSSENGSSGSASASSLVQTDINNESFARLEFYYESSVRFVKRMDASNTALMRLKHAVANQQPFSKDVDILNFSNDLIRLLNGGRVIFCKSGKDRTAMAATLQQAIYLSQYYPNILPSLASTVTDYSASETNDGSNSDKQTVYHPGVIAISNIFREFGVRILIAKKNVGAYLYSFNTIQRMALPPAYRPPLTVVQDMITSVAKRDS